MGTPVFLGLDQIILLHQSMIAAYGGKEGVRDLGLLQSALALPRASSNHTQQGLVDLTLSVAMGKSDKTEIASFFRDKTIADA